jgi:hypothetical protein
VRFRPPNKLGVNSVILHSDELIQRHIVVPGFADAFDVIECYTVIFGSDDLIERDIRIACGAKLSYELGFDPVISSADEYLEWKASKRGAGYQLDDSEPPPGSIMSFDQEGSALLLATEAKSPSDYVGVMMQQLEGETRAA